MTLQPGVTLTTIVRGARRPRRRLDGGGPHPPGGERAGSGHPGGRPVRPRERRRARRPAAGRRLRPAGRGGDHSGHRRLRGRPASAGGSGSAPRRPAPRPTRCAPSWWRPGSPAPAGSPAGTASATDRGPWRVRVLTIDPHRFRGSLVASFGPDIEDRETTSALSRAAGATAAVNAGYFVLDPAAGAPGDPAGVGVYDGKLLSETIDSRPALILRDDARRTAGRAADLVGVGAGPGRRPAPAGRDRPRPRPDPQLRRTATTCRPISRCTTSPAPTPTSWSRSPRSSGRAPRPDRVWRRSSTATSGWCPCGRRGAGRCSRLSDRPGHRDQVAQLQAAAVVGQRLRVSTRLRADGRPVLQRGAATSIVNGGPELVRNGRLHVTPRRDGFVRPTDPSFYYGFSAKRNPRTFAGVDARGRTSSRPPTAAAPTSLGLTIVETGAVARALGMLDALNLDGGGSTTMVVGGQVINQPSDATGERPVGDALLVLPRRAARNAGRSNHGGPNREHVGQVRDDLGPGRAVVGAGVTGPRGCRGRRRRARRRRPPSRRGARPRRSCPAAGRTSAGQVPPASSTARPGPAVGREPLAVGDQREDEDRARPCGCTTIGKPKSAGRPSAIEDQSRPSSSVR